MTTPAISNVTITTREGEYHNDNTSTEQHNNGQQQGGQSEEVYISRSTYRFVLCAALNSCNLGYDIGVSTNAGKLVQEDWNLSDIQREVFVGSINFWAIFGALAAQYVTDVYGRKKTFLVSSVIFIIGVVLMSISQTYSLLMVGRLLVGIGVGVGLAIDPLYIAEISPAKHRGKLVTYAEIALNIGIVLGFATGLIFGNIAINVQWRIMFLCGAILPVVMIIVVLTILPESPRWLVAKDRVDEAQYILQQIYPPNYNVKYVLDEIQESLERDRQAENGAVGWSIIRHPSPGFRRMLVVGVGMAVAQQAIGIDAIQYYLLDVINEAGFDSEQRESVVLILLGLVKLAFVVLGGKLFDSYGRRPLIKTSLIGCGAALFVISICFLIKPSLKPAIIVIALAVYLAFFSIGMGPGGWLIPSEVFTLSIRGPAMSLATMSNRITATVMSSTFLSTAHVLGWGGFFLLLCFVCVIVTAFIHYYLPETKGRSLEDMSIYFAEITNDNSVLEADAALRGGGPGSTNNIQLRPLSTGASMGTDNEVI